MELVEFLAAYSFRRTPFALRFVPDKVGFVVVERVPAKYAGLRLKVSLSPESVALRSFWHLNLKSLQPLPSIGVRLFASDRIADLPTDRITSYP